MHPIQTAYTKAKAKSDVLYRKSERAIRNQELNADDICAAADKAFDNLIAAENDLLNWAYAVVQTHPKYKEHAEELTHLFDRVCFFPEIKNKVIDTCMKLDASTI